MGKAWMIWLGHSVWIAIGLGVWAGPAAIAQDSVASEVNAASEIGPLQALPLSEGDRPATTVADWLAQTQAVQITGVQIIERDGTLELTLQTTGELARPTTAIAGNALIADIPNAVLALPEGDEFFTADPTSGIALVTISSLTNNQVRVAITGTDAPPVAQISVGATALTLSAIPGNSNAGAPADDTIQITVTGEQAGSDYVVPNASTATRTDTPLLEVPQAIQVIPRQVLEDQQIIRVDDALRNVSGVVGDYGSFGSGETLTIRGFATDSFANGPVLRDGFRVYNNLGVQETANLQQIEVLKGPASILYGQIDPGGIINLVTEQPLAEPFYEGQVRAGSYGLVRSSIDFSGPITADAALRYRLNAVVQREDGFRGFVTDSERFFVAPVVAWNISDRTRLSLSLEYLADSAPFDTGLVAIGDRVADVPRDRIVNELDDFRRSETLTLGYDLTHQLSDDWSLRNGFRYVSQDYALQTYLPFSVDETTGIVTRFPADRQYRSDDYTLQTSVVGEFATGPVAHTLLAGIDLNWNRFDELFTRVDLASASPLDIFNPTYGLVPRPDLSGLTPFAPFDTEYDRIGVFLQDQVAITDSLIVVGGLRYDTVDYRNTEDNTSRSDAAWSPRLGVVYQPTEAVSIYASYAQSFVPSFSVGVDGDFLEPETSSGFEVGAKAEFLDGNLFATLAFFDITKRNVATVADPLTGASIATGAQRSQGVELDVQGEILPGWNVIGFYAYTNARITQDNVIPVGNRLANAPEHSAGLWTTYQIQDGSLQGLGVGAGVNYVSNRFGNLANNFEVGSYFLTNAALFYRRPNWQLALNINNLFDVNYISSTSGFNRNTGIRPGEPRSIVGSISVNF